MKRLTREHAVGSWGEETAPAITVDPGETILVETINHMTPIVRGPDDLHAHGSPEYREREETGPIHVRGVRPGDALAIRIEKIDIVGLPHAHGGGPLRAIKSQRPMVFPPAEGRCEMPGGLSVAIRPMVGHIYTAAGPSAEPSPYPDNGGNMDFTEISPGNTLFLPVCREGGMLVLGDVHAFQGDGELYLEGGECAADVTLTLDVDRTYRHPRPLVETPESLIGLGCRGGLFESIQLVLGDMTALVSRLTGAGEEEAYIFCAMVGSVRLAGCLGSERGAQHPLVALSIPKEFR